LFKALVDDFLRGVSEGCSVLHVSIRAYAELNDFLPEARRHREFSRRLRFSTSVKDLLEGAGIPHPEIALLLVDGEPKLFEFLIERSCRVAAYPAFRSLFLGDLPKLQRGYVELPRFVLDVHLGRLSRYLRLVGCDAAYENDATDDWLANTASGDDRCLLTRDRALLMRKDVERGYFVRNDDPIRQLVEVARRFNLAERMRPFSRCLTCNGVLAEVTKHVIEAQLEPETRRNFQQFWQCDECCNVYWKGSHYDRLLNLVELISEPTTGDRSS
jgi:uncharacterized protein